LETFDILHTFLPVNVVKLSTLKNSPAFLAHPVYCYNISSRYRFWDITILWCTLPDCLWPWEVLYCR